MLLQPSPNSATLRPRDHLPVHRLSLHAVARAASWRRVPAVSASLLFHLQNPLLSGRERFELRSWGVSWRLKGCGSHWAISQLQQPPVRTDSLTFIIERRLERRLGHLSKLHRFSESRFFDNSNGLHHYPSGISRWKGFPKASAHRSHLGRRHLRHSCTNRVHRATANTLFRILLAVLRGRLLRTCFPLGNL